MPGTGTVGEDERLRGCENNPGKTEPVRTPLAALALLLLAACSNQSNQAAPHGTETDLGEPSECLNGEVLENGRCVPQGTEE